MKHTLAKTELATALGVQTRTVNRWLKQGCPCSREDGRPFFNAEEVQRWRQQGALDPEDSEPAPAGSVGLPAGTQAALAALQAEFVRKVTSAKKSELELKVEKGLGGLGLDRKILAAKSYEDYVALDLEIGALLARGALTPQRARAIQSVIADARQNTKAHRDAEGDEQPERFVLASEEALQLVDAFEGIVSDARRALILEHVEHEAQVDEEEYPNLDLALDEEAEGNAEEADEEEERTGPDPDTQADEDPSEVTP